MREDEGDQAPTGARDAAAAARVLPGPEGLPALDRLADLARALLGVEAAQLSLLTEVQTVAAGAGLPDGAREAVTPAADSLCTVTARSGAALVVADAPADPRVRGLPPVTGGVVGAYLGVPLRDAGGRTLGALCVFGPTPRRWTPEDERILAQLAEWAAGELELAALGREHARDRERWRLAAGAAGIGTFSVGLPSAELRCDARVMQLVGLPPDHPPPSPAELAARVHPDDRTTARAVIDAALRDGVPYDTELRVLLPDGRVRWLRIRGSVLTGPDGEGEQLLGAAIDTTDARHAHDLVELAAAVGDRLTRDPEADAEDSLRALAQLIVPRLADWVIVSVLGRDGRLRDVATWHHDPALRPVAEAYSATRLIGRADTSVPEAAAISETPQLIVRGALEVARGILRHPEAVRAIEILAPESVVALPLHAGEAAAGALTLLRGAGRPPMSEPELRVASAVAARAGLALDNARLLRDAREATRELNAANARLQRVADHDRSVSQALQEALLTRLPEVDGLTFAARYLTAGDEQVGGDWYDAIALPGGEAVVSLGDVVGHDVRAAAVMGQLRPMLRMAVWDRDEPPSASVQRLDAAIAALGIDTMATLVLLHVEAPSPGRSTRTLRWTNAGHPAPMLLTPDGEAALLDPRTDVMLGFLPETVRSDRAVRAPAGATLLLYSDGLVETRTRSIDAGQAELLAALRRHRALPLEALVDAVIADLVGGAPPDDVAVLAVRLA